MAIVSNAPPNAVPRTDGPTSVSGSHQVSETRTPVLPFRRRQRDRSLWPNPMLAVDTQPDPPRPGEPVLRKAVPPDLKLLLTSLVEAVREHRRYLQVAHRSMDMALSFDLFRAQLETAGLLDSVDTRKERALRERRLGQLAENRGDVRAARLHYEHALRSWRRVGCARHLERLRRQNRS